MAIATLTIDVVAKLASLERDLGKMSHAVDKFSKNTTSAVKVVTGAFAAMGVTVSVNAFKNMVTGIYEVEDATGKAAEKAGIAVDAFSELSFAVVKLSDVTEETLQVSLKALNENITEAAHAGKYGSSELGRIGVAALDASEKIRPTKDILLDVADKFSGMADGAEKSTIAVKLFGKAGRDMIPFLNQGRAGIEEATEAARKFGIVVDDKARAAAERFNDNMQLLHAAGFGLERRIADGLLPVLGELAQQMVDVEISGTGVGAAMKDLTSRDTIRSWAESAAGAAAFVVDGFRGVSSSIQAVAITLSAGVAQANALLHGEVGGAAQIGEQWKADLENLFTFDTAQEGVTRFFEEFDRTVREGGHKWVFNTKQDAAMVRDEFERLAVERIAAERSIIPATEEQVKIQERLRKSYDDEHRRAMIGETNFAIEQIELRYKKEFDAIKGLSDESELRKDIEKRMQAEIYAAYHDSTEKRVNLEVDLTNATMIEAQKRVGIETDAANQVVAVWSQANLEQSQRTGGVIQNRGTPGEFVSSWDANGNYVGQFATGGSFTVGGSGGTDSQRIVMDVTPGERVSVQTPQQQHGAPSGHTFNFYGINDVGRIMAEIQQALRVNPNALGSPLVRGG